MPAQIAAPFQNFRFEHCNRNGLAPNYITNKFTFSTFYAKFAQNNVLHVANKIFSALPQIHSHGTVKKLRSLVFHVKTIHGVKREGYFHTLPEKNERFLKEKQKVFP